MRHKIGRILGKEGLYPNVFSVVVNRCLARCRKKGETGEPADYFEYARLVEERYRRKKNE